MLRVTLLGCGGSGGVPLLGGRDGGGEWGDCDPAEPRNRRTRTAAMIESSLGERLLVDAGPDLRQQMLACRIGIFDSVIFTHAHADHILGIDDIRQVNRTLGRAIAAEAPADRVLVETDSPYLAPVPLRGKRCEPGYVAHTAKVLAETRGLGIAEAAALTTANFFRLFPKAA